jgi:hypothetical protein
MHSENILQLPYLNSTFDGYEIDYIWLNRVRIFFRIISIIIIVIGDRIPPTMRIIAETVKNICSKCKLIHRDTAPTPKNAGVKIRSIFIAVRNSEKIQSIHTDCLKIL